MDILPVRSLKRDPNHPRRKISKRKLGFLVRSIMNDGLQSPIKVVKASGLYHIIDGVYRVLALMRIGYIHVPCVVYEGYSDSESAYESYRLNQEENRLDRKEKAAHLRRVMVKFNSTLQDLEEMGYGTKDSITDILNHPDPVREPKLKQIERITKMKNEIIEIRIDQLTKSPNHPRQERGDLEGLTRSIRKDGIINPIVVQKVEEGCYHIIDGDRRVEVAKTLGYETVPCLVYEGLTPGQSAHKSYILNTERNQLNAIERAQHIKRMKDEFNYTYEHLVILGYGSKSYISKIINLLDLPKKIQKQIIKGKLTPAHGEALRKLEDPAKIERAAKFAIDNEWSVKKTENSVERLNRNAKKESKKEEPKADVPAQEIPGVYFKDSTNMSEIPDKSVGCIFTSPPYFVGMEFELGYTFAEHQENVKEVMAECARVLVPGGVLVLNVADINNFKGEKGTDKMDRVKPMLSFYQSCLSKHGIFLQDQIIWVKDSNPFTQDFSVNYTDKTVHAQYRIVNRHEPIYIFRKKGERVLPSEDIILQSRITREEWKVYGPSVWNIDRIRKAEGHPAVFPDELARRIIKMYSFVGDTVLDPFLGSGTTIKVARELGRDGVGYERDLRYKATILAKLGVEEPETEGVGEFVQKVLEDLEASQPEAPKVEIMASEGMLKYLEEQHSEQEMELETV